MLLTSEGSDFVHDESKTHHMEMQERKSLIQAAGDIFLLSSLSATLGKTLKLLPCELAF